VAYVNKDLDDLIGDGKIGRPGHFKHRGGQTKTILQDEGEKT
jgi:hypothetical protein